MKLRTLNSHCLLFPKGNAPEAHHMKQQGSDAYPRSDASMNMPSSTWKRASDLAQRKRNSLQARQKLPTGHGSAGPKNGATGIFTRGNKSLGYRQSKEGYRGTRYVRSENHRHHKHADHQTTKTIPCTANPAFVLLDLSIECASAMILPTMIWAPSARIGNFNSLSIHHLTSNASTHPPPPTPQPPRIQHRHTQLPTPRTTPLLPPHNLRLQRHPRLHRSHCPRATQRAFHLEPTPASKRGPGATGLFLGRGQ